MSLTQEAGYTLDLAETIGVATIAYILAFITAPPVDIHTL